MSGVAKPNLLWAGSTAISNKIKTKPKFLIILRLLRLPKKKIGRLTRPNSNNRVKCPISKVSKGPNRVRDKPEDRTDHSESSLRYRFR